MLLRRSLIVVAVMLVALLLLAACAEETTTTTRTGQYGGVYKVNCEVPCMILGWPPDSGGGGVFCTTPYAEYLAYHVRGGQSYEPQLATSWELAPDRSSFTVHLRQGVKFHDGSDLNAEAVKFSCNGWVEAGRRVDWESIEVIDDYTIRFNFNRAYENTFIPDILGRDIKIVSQANFEENGEDWARNNPVGTGPFKFVSHERDLCTVWTRNDDYWQEGLPYLDGIEMYYITDPMTASLALQTGELNATHVVGTKMAADLKDLGFDYLTRHESALVLVPDGGNPDSPYYDKRVREAIEYAIDRDAIAAAKSFGLYTGSYQLPIPGEVGYDPDFVGRQYDPDKARQLLEDAGYPDGFETKIMPAPGPYDPDEMVIIQQFLAEVDIALDIDLVDFGRWIDYGNNGWHNGILGHFGPYHWEGNPNYTLKQYYGPQRAGLVSMYESENFYAALAESLVTTDPDDEAIRKVYRALFDDAVFIPLHSTADVIAMQKGIHDHGHYSGAYWEMWTPETLWIEQ